MFIKIEYKGKEELHECESIYTNHLENQAADINIQKASGEMVKRHFHDLTEPDIYIMNNEGKKLEEL